MEDEEDDEEEAPGTTSASASASAAAAAAAASTKSIVALFLSFSIKSFDSKRGRGLGLDALRDAIGDGVELIFYCTNDEWTVVNGLITGSQKVSSAMVKKKYLVLFE